MKGLVFFEWAGAGYLTWGMKWLLPSCCFFLVTCATNHSLQVPQRTSSLTGTAFYRAVVAMKWRERDSLAVLELRAGNLPSFLKKLVPIQVTVQDSISRNTHKIVYYVSPDYLAIGTDDDWARIPLTPMAAQQIADLFDCFLPTRKMVDDIYLAAPVKLEPVPMYAYRDSTITMWHHHLIIEGQRKNRKGLIAGIKKDLVISGKVSRDSRAGREAIYGWHKSDGKPIQPLYTGHINWWVDYSHGIRLVYNKIKVDGSWVDYRKVLVDPVLQKALCDEEHCDFFRYEY